MGSDRLYKEIWNRFTMSDGRRSQVVLLDERRLDILIQPRLYACDLLDMVASHFNLKEKEYFGLAFLDETGHYHWLQLDKRVLEHDLPKKSSQGSLVLYFLVKYYVESISLLKDSATVEAFYLQCKSLIAKGALEVDSETVFQLAALVLQATYGNYVDDQTTKTHLKKLPVLPTSTLKAHPSISYCEGKVIEHYQELAGRSRGSAIIAYMNLVENLPTYGIHFYEVKDKGGIPWWVGLSYKGVSQYDYNDKKTPRRFFQWKLLENLYFRDKKFSIEVHNPRRVVHALSSFNVYEDVIEAPPEGFDPLADAISDSTTQVSVSRRTFGPGNVTVVVWFAATPALTKSIWSMAIAQHQFYLDNNVGKRKIEDVSCLEKFAAELSKSSQSLSSTSTGSNLSRSASCHSLPAIKIEDETDQPQVNEEAERAKQEMLTALKARKEALEEALRKKIEELKSVCLKEGEVTGELPPEMPLAPGEPPPQVRRRIGTAFILDDQLLSSAKSKEETLSSLELEYELQNKITSAALRLASDMSADRSLRRQRKLSYQQAQEKLKQVEQKLGTLKKQKNHGKLKPVQQSDDEPSEDNISQSTAGSDTPFRGSSNTSDISPTASPKLSSYDGHLTEKHGRLPTVSSVPSDMRLSPSLASVSAPASPCKHRTGPGRTASPGVAWTGYGSGYAPSNVYQTRTAYRRQQYPTLTSSGSAGSSPVPLKFPYRDRFESVVNVEGSNLYSVPTQRTSQAFDSQDDLMTNSPSEPQDLGLVSRHNSLESNRRHHRRVAGTSLQPVSPTKHDSATPPRSTAPAWTGPPITPPMCPPGQCTPGQCPRGQCDPGQCTTVQCAPGNCEPIQCSLEQCAPMQCAPGQCAPGQCSPGQCSPRQCSPGQCAPGKCVPVPCASLQSPLAQCSPTQYLPGHCAPMQCPPTERVESHPRLPPHIQHQYRTASPLQIRRTVSGSLSYPESFPPPPSPVVGGNQHHPSKSYSYTENMVRHIDECGVPVFVPVDSDGRLRYQDAVHRPTEPVPIYHKPPMLPALMQHHLAHRKKLQEACGDNFPGRPLSSMSTSNYPAFQRVHPDPYHSQPTSPTGYSAAHSTKLETLQEGHSGTYSNHTVSVTSSKAFASVTQSYSTETLKHRTKDWVETSLDSPLPARKPSKQQEPPPVSPSRASVLSSGSESLPEVFQSPGVMLSRHNSCREGRVAVESPQLERDKICSPLHQPSPKTMPGVELNIVTVGHFQPYWEETKPYEISDFYKYSTKHRKPSGGQDSTRSPSQSGNSSGLVSPVLMSPVSADNVSRERDEQPHAHSSLSEHMKMVERSPPDGMAAVEEPHSGRSADSSLNLDRSSVADAFHEEMIAWYQDQDSGNKATLV
ncbi:uncharacterized protein LOC119174679 isoform X4 [Rhipicephalus microplus]|uniref:uncharacterized protein LOC119174679 isoform X4 n=1 Tax=Rhipicephalus microplus TaxID=6941 RepID=UPI003F6C6F0E